MSEGCKVRTEREWNKKEVLHKAQLLVSRTNLQERRIARLRKLGTTQPDVGHNLRLAVIELREQDQSAYDDDLIAW
jgi:hypothetical protein